MDGPATPKQVRGEGCRAAFEAAQLLKDLNTVGHGQDEATPIRLDKGSATTPVSVSSGEEEGLATPALPLAKTPLRELNPPACVACPPGTPASDRATKRVKSALPVCDACADALVDDEEAVDKKADVIASMGHVEEAKGESQATIPASSATVIGGSTTIAAADAGIAAALLGMASDDVGRRASDAAADENAPPAAAVGVEAASTRKSTRSKRKRA